MMKFKVFRKILTPLYKGMAFLAGLLASKLELDEHKREGKNLMNISCKSVL